MIKNRRTWFLYRSLLEMSSRDQENSSSISLESLAIALFLFEPSFSIFLYFQPKSTTPFNPSNIHRNLYRGREMRKLNQKERENEGSRKPRNLQYKQWLLMSISVPPFIAFTQRESHSIMQSQSNIKERKSSHRRNSSPKVGWYFSNPLPTPIKDK